MELQEKISRAQLDERVTSGRCRVAYDKDGRIQFVTEAQQPEFEQRGYTLAAKPTPPPTFASLNETETETDELTVVEKVKNKPGPKPKDNAKV